MRQRNKPVVVFFHEGTMGSLGFPEIAGGVLIGRIRAREGVVIKKTFRAFGFTMPETAIRAVYLYVLFFDFKKDKMYEHTPSRVRFVPLKKERSSYFSKDQVRSPTIPSAIR